MPALRINQFAGEAPKLSTRLLPDQNAQVAKNLRMSSGRIDPVYYPADVAATLQTGTIRSIYRMTDSDGDSFWLNWTSDVDIVKGPIAGDISFRHYFASDEFEPRATNLALATSLAPFPTAWYVLGVTPPTTAPTVTPSGGTAPAEARTYVYTFVTQWGEESAPSPASSSATGNINGTWALSAMQVAPSNSYTISAASWAAGVLTLTVNTTFGLRAGERVTITGLAPSSLNTSHEVATAASTTVTIALAADPGTITDQTGAAARDAPHNTTTMMKRIYRSVTVGSTTSFFYVKEIAVATTTANDDVGSDIGEEIPTTGWAMPPADLQGLRVLPSGALVGFRENEVCFSEPLIPYAWPTAYRLTTDYKVVAIGAFGTSIAVATQGVPYVGAGVEPASFTLTKLDQSWPCLSKRGLVEMGPGIAWPAPQGLVMVGLTGSQLLTDATYTMTEWTTRAPDTFIGALFDGQYYAGYEVDDETFGMFVWDPDGTTWRMTPLITAAYTDPQTGAFYVVEGDTIKEWDSNTAYRMPYEWWSKEVVLPQPINLGAARVEAEFAISASEEAAYNTALALQQAENAAAIALNATGGSMNGVSANTYSLNGSSVVPGSLVGDGQFRYVTFELYAYQDMIFSKTVSTDTTFRLPSGMKYDQFSIRLLGNVPTDSVLVGETPQALRTA